MSQLIFPSFHVGTINYTFPVKKTPSFSTTIQTPYSGRGEVRISNQTFPIWMFEYDLSYILGNAMLANSAWQQFVGFYGAVQGAGDDWLFLDPLHNAVQGQAIGNGDGTTKQFLFVTTISDMVSIVQDFVSAPSVFVAGVLKSPGTDYSVDAYGNIFFTTAPASGTLITWTGSYYFRCRFMEDSLTGLQMNLLNIWECQSLKFKQVIL